MGKQCYIQKNFRSETLDLIQTIDEIIDEYTDQGYRLTVRQLYYQLVARGIVENTERSYKRITSTVNDAKMAGYLDWEAIEDRTREFIRSPRWESGSEILKSAAASFRMDMWANQERRVFVIVEKEALAGVLEGVCESYDVPLLAARGYPSGTVLREFAVSDLIPALSTTPKQAPYIIHLGDHDPSGIDMTRDLSERFFTFCTGDGEMKGILPAGMFRRVALTMEQIQDQRPPPNPAKTTDARFRSYRQEYGDESWELDALSPEFLTGLVRDHITTMIDWDAWKLRKDEVTEIRERLSSIAEKFDE